MAEVEGALVGRKGYLIGALYLSPIASVLHRVFDVLLRNIQLQIAIHDGIPAVNVHFLPPISFHWAFLAVMDQDLRSKLAVMGGDVVGINGEIHGESTGDFLVFGTLKNPHIIGIDGKFIS